ncbi:hypothetical protein BDW75DRAFT_212655 [Aspergillus navahoensis]
MGTKSKTELVRKSKKCSPFGISEHQFRADVSPELRTRLSIDTPKTSGNTPKDHSYCWKDKQMMRYSRYIPLFWALFALHGCRRGGIKLWQWKPALKCRMTRPLRTYEDFVQSVQKMRGLTCGEAQRCRVGKAWRGMGNYRPGAAIPSSINDTCLELKDFEPD